MNPDDIVRRLLREGIFSDEEETDMLNDLTQVAVDPLYGFMSAVEKHAEWEQSFPARDPWAFDLKIQLSEALTVTSKLRFVSTHWNRGITFAATHHFSPGRDSANTHMPFKMEHAQEVLAALKNLVAAAARSTIGNEHMWRAWDDVRRFEWVPKNPIRRRRRSWP